jgi:hypothetical protein
MRKVQCPKCHTGYTDSENILSIQTQGECLSCEHVRAEELEEKLREEKGEQYEKNVI